MLSLDHISLLLKDRRLSVVAEATGLNPATIAAIRDGKETNPKYGTIKLLSSYLTREPAGE